MDKLRDKIQKSAYRAWVAKGKRGTIVMATGTGKTRVALRAIEDAPEGSTVLFLAEQTDRQFDLSKEIDKMKDLGSDVLSGKEFKFLTYQSAYRMRGQHADLVICDEIHSSMTPQYSKFYGNNSYDAVLGLTATPELRKQVTQTATKSALYKKFCPIVYKYTINDAALMGTARKLNIYVIDYKITDKELEVYQKHTRSLSHGIATGTEWQINKAMQQRTRHILNLGSRQELAEKVLGVLKGKTLIFGNTLKRLQELTPNVVSSRNYPYKNDQIRKAFDEGDIDIMASYKKLQQGANVGAFDNLLIHSYYSDTGKLVQRLGRLRKDGDKQGFVVILKNEQTNEKKWFNKMMDVLDPSIYNIKNFTSLEDFIQTYQRDR